MNRLITTLVQVSLWLVVLWCMKEAYNYHKAEYWQHMVEQAKQANVTKHRQMTHRIVYFDGAKTNVVHVDMVDSRTFWSFNLDRQPYGLIDRNSRTIYLDVRRYQPKR